jgi:hypothetical protein
MSPCSAPAPPQPFQSAVAKSPCSCVRPCPCSCTCSSFATKERVLLLNLCCSLAEPPLDGSHPS